MPYSTHVAFRWFSPTARRMRWCRWSVSADITLSAAAPPPPDSSLLSSLLRMASEVSKTGTPIASSGTPTDTRNEFGACDASGRTAITKPRNIDPQSPRNTDAGL